jgi:3',5'-cyclic AMP phosphodiesterase CpdA
MRPKKQVQDFAAQVEKSPEGIARKIGIQNVERHLSAETPRVFSIPTGAVRVAVFGDTHFGSRFEEQSGLKVYAQECLSAGTEHALHAGDVLEGHRLYRGQEYETDAHGWEEQSQRFVDRIKDLDFGCPVSFITGNHDISFLRAGGINVGSGLQTEANVRAGRDWRFVGQDQGRVDIGGIDWMLLHPGGGSAYALSYRPQKIVEQIEGGSKPDVLLIGNFHKSEMIPSYRNVCAIQVGCFQRQTPFMLTKGLSAHMGGWIIDAAKNKGTVDIKARFISFK